MHSGINESMFVTSLWSINFFQFDVRSVSTKGIPDENSFKIYLDAIEKRFPRSFSKDYGDVRVVIIVVYSYSFREHLMLVE